MFHARSTRQYNRGTLQEMEHLEASLAGVRALCKDLDDEPYAVQHRRAPGSLQVALLHAAQHGVHEHPACTTMLDAFSSHAGQPGRCMLLCCSCQCVAQRASTLVGGRAWALEAADCSSPEEGGRGGRKALRGPHCDAAAPAACIRLRQPQRLLQCMPLMHGREQFANNGSTLLHVAQHLDMVRSLVAWVDEQQPLPGVAGKRSYPNSQRHNRCLSGNFSGETQSLAESVGPAS